VSGHEDYFRGIDFDKAWEEEDWERFFDAQDRLSRALRPDPPPARGRPVPGLGFREVLRRFGMDPDNPLSAPKDFEGPPAPPSDKRRFWEEGVEAEALPVFSHARVYARGVRSLMERRFPDVALKTYKSKSHRLLQQILSGLEVHAAAVPAQIAAGHGLGYRADRVKGNIVRCRRALAHADECLGLATRLPRRFLSTAEYKCLVSDTARLRNAVQDWVFLLRERFTRRFSR
jgi:hypothetical protein